MTNTNAKGEFTLEIESLSYGPYGIGRLSGQVIMIPATVPGDRVSARVTQSKGNYAVGEMVQLLDSSALRQTPPCPYATECGGCPWQQVRYETQLEAKQRSVQDALKRIGKLQDFELRPIVPSPRQFHYRRRIRLQCDKNKRLGFYHPFSHAVVEINSCLIADDLADRYLLTLRSWIQGLRTPIKEIEIVVGDEAKQIVVFGRADGLFMSQDEEHCAALLAGQTELSGIILSGLGWRRLWGQTRISVFPEDGICLKADGDVFTQVNRESNRKILQELLRAGAFEERDRVLELYCGAGNFTLSVAKRVSEVIAVESYRHSIESGKLSAQLNGVENIHWVTGQVAAQVKRLRQQGQQFSKIILDPPRTGAKGIDHDIACFGAEKILYVSCNPTTLARDLSALTKHGYKLTFAQPIDLFPHTYHVEALAEMIC